MRRLNDQEIKSELATITAWTLDGDAIMRKIDCGTFANALMLINAVGHHAERANHHPEIHNVYKWVTFTLSTHDAGVLTEKDFALARQIDLLLTD